MLFFLFPSGIRGARRPEHNTGRIPRHSSRIKPPRQAGIGKGRKRSPHPEVGMWLRKVTGSSPRAQTASSKGFSSRMIFVFRSVSAESVSEPLQLLLLEDAGRVMLLEFSSY